EWAPEPDDAATLIRVVRANPPKAVPINKAAVDEARRIADQIRAALELPDRDPHADLPRNRLLAASVAATPELAFVRRAKRRGALGNEGSEVRPADESRFPEDAEAAVVFDQHAVPGKGTTATVNLATCMAPVTLETLAEQELGKLEYAEPEWDGERVTVTARRIYAGRTLSAEATEPEGKALREALADLVLAGKVFDGLGDNLREEAEAWNVYVLLGYGEGEPVEDIRRWLVDHFAGLGVEHPEDVALVEADDLAFEGIPDWERGRFDRHFPRRLNLEGIGDAPPCHSARSFRRGPAGESNTATVRAWFPSPETGPAGQWARVSAYVLFLFSPVRATPRWATAPVAVLLTKRTLPRWSLMIRYRVPPLIM
ncbi:MAG: hypothetical protein ABEJ96_07255, partial [Thiohalorhabdaceae bacterium]